MLGWVGLGRLELQVQAFASDRSLYCAPAQMVVAARISWLRQQAINGAYMTYTTSQASDPDKAKFTVRIFPDRHAVHGIAQTSMVQLLDTLSHICHNAVVVDRGHKYSSGVSESCFWVSGTSRGTVGTHQHGAMDPITERHSTGSI